MARYIENVDFLRRFDGGLLETPPRLLFGDAFAAEASPGSAAAGASPRRRRHFSVYIMKIFDK